MSLRAHPVRSEIPLWRKMSLRNQKRSPMSWNDVLKWTPMSTHKSFIGLNWLTCTGYNKAEHLPAARLRPETGKVVPCIWKHLWQVEEECQHLSWDSWRQPVNLICGCRKMITTGVDKEIFLLDFVSNKVESFKHQGFLSLQRQSKWNNKLDDR